MDGLGIGFRWFLVDLKRTVRLREAFMKSETKSGLGNSAPADPIQNSQEAPMWKVRPMAGSRPPPNTRA